MSKTTTLSGEEIKDKVKALKSEKAELDKQESDIVLRRRCIISEIAELQSICTHPPGNVETVPHLSVGGYIGRSRCSLCQSLLPRD